MKNIDIILSKVYYRNIKSLFRQIKPYDMGGFDTILYSHSMPKFKTTFWSLIS